MSTKLTTDQIAKLRTLGATAFKRQRVSPPRNEGISIVEMNYWTDGWLQAQQFAERQKVLDEERKLIADETRYIFLGWDGGTNPNVVRERPEEIVKWAIANDLSGWVIPVVGGLIAPPVKKKVAKSLRRKLNKEILK